MFTNRLFNVVVVLALATMVLFTVQEASTTATLVKADRGYDQVEQMRSVHLDTNLQVDRSYDVVEARRLEALFTTTDHSYEQIEVLRTQRRAADADRSYDPVEDLRVMRAWQP